MPAGSWDYIVVGAGSAGCVVASRLSENPRNSVLLLEAGPPDRSAKIRVPAGELFAIADSNLNWQYRTEPDRSLNGRTLVWPAGKTLGGSSSINGMVYVRGQREDYDGWARSLGNTKEWSYQDVLPCFRKMETNPFGKSEYHGDSGPLEVSDVPSPHKLTRAFIESAVEVGIPFNPDINGGTQEGVGPNQGTIKFGRRNSTARAYLRRARRRPNLKILTNTLVERVLFDGRQVKGVRLVRRERCEEVAAHREVIVCSGTIGSAALLLRSGIGPGADLSPLGIEVVNDLKGVGCNIQEHPAAWVSNYVNVSTYNVETKPWHFVKHGLDWMIRGSGPAASPIAQAVAFARTRPEEETRPDVQFHFSPVGYEVTDKGIRFLDRPAVTNAFCVLRPRSRSEIVLRSSSPFEPPKIISRLLDDPDDVERLLGAFRIARRLFVSRAFSPYDEGPCVPSDRNLTDDEILAFFRSSVEGSYHPVGSCKMGVSEDSVVDAQLRVQGVAGLRVADASIMPTLTSGNTNAPTIMIGEKASDMLQRGR